MNKIKKFINDINETRKLKYDLNPFTHIARYELHKLKKELELEKTEMCEIKKFVNSAERKILVYIFELGIIEELIDMDIMNGSKSLTPKGKIIFEYLKDINFKPTDKETKDFLDGN